MDGMPSFFGREMLRLSARRMSQSKATRSPLPMPSLHNATGRGLMYVIPMKNCAFFARHGIDDEEEVLFRRLHSGAPDPVEVTLAWSQ